MQVIRRQQWNARAPRSVTHLGRQEIDAFVVHYSAAHVDMGVSHDQCPSRVRAIQNYHMDTKEWNDIAYNWLWCRHGVIFEGRGWLVMSAATLGHNDHTQAFCFLGADREGRDDVTVLGRAAIADSIQTGFRQVHRQAAVAPHSSYVRTECPGNELRAWIRAKGWLQPDPEHKPWPIPVEQEFWLWARWRRSRWEYPNRLAWMRARPRPVAKKYPFKVPEWYWVRIAAMGG